MTTAAALLASGTNVLSACGAEAEANCQWLLSHLTGKSRLELIARPDFQISPETERAFFSLIGRRKKGEPLAYIIGSQPFMGRDFAVTPAVLIPRPETEELVEQTLRLRPPQKLSPILDLCTGSGCIAVTLAVMTEARVAACDISPDALAVAAQNSLANKTLDRVTFVRSDLFDNINGKFSLIISNPPYVTDGAMATLQTEVRFEPALALRGGGDGLDLVRRILSRAPHFLLPDGLIAMEVGAHHKDELVRLTENGPWKKVFFGRDFNGFERFFFAEI